MAGPCELICVEGTIYPWALLRIAALGFFGANDPGGNDQNFWSGEYQDTKASPYLSLFLEELFAFPPQRMLDGGSCRKSQHQSRMRLLLRGNKEADGETKQLMRQVINCLDFPNTADLASISPVWSVRFVDGQPFKRPKIEGHPIYSADFDVFWCQEEI